MKRLLFIVALLCVIISAGILESIYSSRYFRRLHSELTAVNDSLIAASETGDFSDAKKKSRDILKDWNKKQKLLLIITNHTIVRNFEEKLVSMVAWIDCDGYGDSRAFCEAAIVLAKDLSDEASPHIGNLV